MSFIVGSYLAQGKREAMEDAATVYVHHHHRRHGVTTGGAMVANWPMSNVSDDSLSSSDDSSSSNSDAPPPHPKTSSQGSSSNNADGGETRIKAFVGVYDGHGGHEMSSYLQKKLHLLLLDALHRLPTEAWSDRVMADGEIIRVFEELDHKLHDRWRLRKPKPSESAGSTALVLMMTNENELIVANVGDCRAVLCKRQTKSAVNVTHDQTPQLQRERERIRSVGATIIAGSVFGVLSMTRAFGDFELKTEERPKRAIISTPEIFRVDVSDAEFIILASDGFWDVISNQGAVAEAQTLLSQYQDDPLRCDKVAKALVEHALKLGTDDNTSVVIVEFIHSD